MITDSTFARGLSRDNSSSAVPSIAANGIGCPACRRRELGAAVPAKQVARPRFTRALFFERRGLDEIADDANRVVLFAEVVDANDVGMMELRAEASQLTKPEHAEAYLARMSDIPHRGDFLPGTAGRSRHPYAH